MIKRLTVYLAAILWLIPFGCMVLIALNKTNTSSFAALLDPGQFTLQNFVDAWQGANFSGCFLNTLVVTLFSTAAILMMSAMAGYVLSQYQFRGKKLLVGLMSITVLIPTVFFTIPVFQILKMMGVDQSLLGLILAEVGGTHVIFILLFQQFYNSLPEELLESARMDGCGQYQVFFKICFPMAKPVIGTVVITQAIWTWNSFLFPLILSLNNPSLRTLSVGIYSFQGENIVNWSAMAAAGCITILPMVLLFLCFQKYFISGIEGAVKG